MFDVDVDVVHGRMTLEVGEAAIHAGHSKLGILARVIHCQNFLLSLCDSLFILLFSKVIAQNTYEPDLKKSLARSAYPEKIRPTSRGTSATMRRAVRRSFDDKVIVQCK